MKIPLRSLIFEGLFSGYLFLLFTAILVRPTEDMTMLAIRNPMWPLGAFAFGLLVCFVSKAAGLVSMGEHLFGNSHHLAASVGVEKKIWWKTLWGWQFALFLIGTLGVGAEVTQFSIFELQDEQGFDGMLRLFKGLANPNWELLPRAIYRVIETIFMAFMATAIAIPVAFFLCFFAAKNLMSSALAKLVYTLLRTLLNITRSIEAFIWAIIFSVWVGIGPFAGLLALAVHSVASLTKQYSEIVESVSEGPIEGIRSTGAHPLQVIWFAIVPQVVLPFISFTIYRWDINIRMATIVGFVGGGGIGTLLITYQNSSMWPEVGTIFLVIAVVVWLMDLASAHIREVLK